MNPLTFSQSPEHFIKPIFKTPTNLNIKIVHLILNNESNKKYTRLKQNRKHIKKKR